MRIRLEWVGCRLNSGEIDALARRLTGAGHAVVGAGEPADLCVVNTCTVTSVAARKSRQLIRRIRRAHPGARLVATGCLAELEARSLERLGVDLVVGNGDKDTLLEVATDHGLIDAAPSLPVAPAIPAAAAQRTRAFVKVQDGCDNRCAFCVVTVARGPGRSVAASQVVSEVRALVGLGYREVVLSGVHLGSYGHDRGRRRGLEALIRHVLGETDLPRLRLSSLEPWDLDPEFFRLFDDPRLLPHLHLPLQSGSDATLRRMARKSTVAAYSDLVTAARDAIDDVAISTDVMVGFPGESDAEFEESLNRVEALELSRLHVFRYSRRDGTPAAALPNQVPGQIAAERSRRMQALGDDLARRFCHRHIGRSADVLWEQGERWTDVARWRGLTGNYIRVETETAADVDLGNTITATRLDAITPGGMTGTVTGG